MWSSWRPGLRVVGRRQRLYDPRRARSAELLGHPDADADQRIEVDAVLDAEAGEQPHQVLGGEITGGTFGVRAAAEPTRRRVERRDSGPHRREHAGQRLAVRVVEVHRELLVADADR